MFNALFNASNLDGLSACSKVLSQTGNTIFFKSSNLESKTSASAPKPSSSNQFDILTNLIYIIILQHLTNLGHNIYYLRF